MSDVARIPDRVMELTDENFLALYDVALDIRQELQMSDDPVIPILQQLVKFPILMPFDSARMRDRYCEFRWKATQLLKAQGVIRSCEFLRGLHRWRGRLQISADRSKFDGFVKLLDAERNRRTPPDASAEDLRGQVTTPDSSEALRNLLLRFHAVVIQLRQRHDGRPTLDVNDEYDVQDLLHALLCLHFDDIRPEEWTPSYAGKSSRVDFLLKREEVVVEIKKTRQGLTERQIGDELIV